MGTTGTSSALASCSSFPLHTSCGSSDGSRGYSIAFGAFSSSATKSRSSSVGMLTRVSFVWRIDVISVGVFCERFAIASRSSLLYLFAANAPTNVLELSRLPRRWYDQTANMAKRGRKSQSDSQSGLRLKLEGQVTLQRLGQALDAWTDFLREVARDVVGSSTKDAVRFVITEAKGGSVTLG